MFEGHTRCETHLSLGFLVEILRIAECGGKRKTKEFSSVCEGGKNFKKEEEHASQSR